MIKNKYIFFVFFLLAISAVFSQIGNYNHYPTMTPTHILDEKLTDISFAISMRVLESNYNGPLLRLRRSSDNAERDFGWGDNDKIDVDAIIKWSGEDNVFIHTWYDQSGLNRNAVQTNPAFQPEFVFQNISVFRLRSDGVDDHLIIDTPNGIQDVTNQGNQGTVITLALATKKGEEQGSFGVVDKFDNRWSAHINHGDSKFYFDPGNCCPEPRSFENKSGEGKWKVYTLIKTSNRSIARREGVEMFNGDYTGRCTLTLDFAIGCINGNNGPNQVFGTTGFNEFIMYKTNIDPIQYQEIEQSLMAFWRN
ncbi:MAG: hypothetical protein ACK5H1_10050 [Tenacibaculum sp.]